MNGNNGNPLVTCRDVTKIYGSGNCAGAGAAAASISTSTRAN